MIALSSRAAARFGYRWKDLCELHGDGWKIDVIMVSRYPVLLIVHEYTLYTLVRRKADFKTIDSVTREISYCCPWYKFGEQIAVGRNTNRKLNGSINEMKRVTAGDYSMNFALEIEDTINNCLFSALSIGKYGYGKPTEAVEKYRTGEWPVATQ